ncbi:hypothetical protein MADA3029_480001 [Vibrio nigripulchritudo MADA3029]|nr:hypothetical protein VIBNIMADA3020_80001 [Vibrio nigripulchritudo MADA3020]CCN51549.1 hypothetical protein VIBNIMADA3021_1110003 [Vibrio nigripulchritudo MADA3021]CCN59823.1 hypothetical protein MADA3029_480001 [Vibrio nigripulchritudo MADA3029]
MLDIRSGKESFYMKDLSRYKGLETGIYDLLINTSLVILYLRKSNRKVYLCREEE